MAITTRNLGKLGGAVETREQAVNGTSYVLLPIGWKKAVGVFTATKPSIGEVAVFNVPFTLASEAKINGGGCSESGQACSETSPAPSPGTGSNNPTGGGLSGHHHDTHRCTRNRQLRSSSVRRSGCRVKGRDIHRREPQQFRCSDPARGWRVDHHPGGVLPGGTGTRRKSNESGSSGVQEVTRVVA